ncbi:MAG: hypothetical protein ACJAYU_003145 [Bradymonadia bacterium]|jgi:hypothetical protein
MKRLIPALGLLAACGGSQAAQDEHVSSGLEAQVIESVEAIDWNISETGFMEGRLGEATADAEGRYYQTYLLDLPVGATMRLWVHSSDFDTTLRVRGPAGLDLYNDDYWHGTDSMLQFQGQDEGPYELVLSSYSVEEIGLYQLHSYTFSPEEFDPTLDLGDNLTTDLSESGAGPGGGDGSASVWFEANAGQRVHLRVTSPSFDTTARLVSPNGQSWYNDDANDVGEDGTESTLDSTLDAIAPDDGWYQLIVAPYGGQTAGQFTVRSEFREAVTVSEDQQTPDVGFAGTETMGRMYGIYAGITNYGPDDQLYGCADDASNVADAFVQRRMQAPEDQVILRDKEATSGAFEAAVRELSSVATEDDVVVIFYSGHGGIQPVDEEHDEVELDGTDETLVFIDRQMTDNEFVDLMDLLNVNTIILAIDACQSGGFARDFMTEPGRIGLFSSDEDVLSSTAEPVEAGGYLSYMMHQGVLGWADAMPNDGAMLAGEFTDYMIEIGAEQHRNMNPEGSDAPLQRMIIERGSYNWSDILWVYPRAEDGQSLGPECGGVIGDTVIGGSCQ